MILLVVMLSACSGMTKFSRGKMQSRNAVPYTFPIESIDGIIVVKAVVNGVEGRFILDNGFSLCALDKSFAARANVNFTKTGTVNDANNNRIELKETKITSVSIGPYELHNAFGNQLLTAKFLPCDSIDGVIGASFINRVNWEFDFDKHQATISRDLPETAGAIELGFRTANNNISYTELTIGNRKARAMIDFGYQGHIQLKKDIFLHQFQGQSAEVRCGIHSLSVSGLGNIDTSYILRNIPVNHQDSKLVPTIELTLKSSLKRDAVIGINYLENYRFLIDNKNHRYLLYPRANYQPVTKLNFNASLYVMDSTIKILQVNVNDDIAHQLELMQTVTTIDNLPSEVFLDVCYLKSYLQEKREQKKPVSITINGEKRIYEIQSTSVAREIIQ